MSRFSYRPISANSSANTRRAILALVWWVLPMLILANPICVSAQDGGAVVSVSGRAEMLRGQDWRQVAPGAAIGEGDSVRTGEDSRVAIQLANGMQIKLNANSHLELKQISLPVVPASSGFVSNLFRVLRGEIWIRAEDGTLEVQTRPATATIRGTEFDLAVRGRDSARLVVVQGVVELANPLGSVLVAANETGTARVGRAPRKTILINPMDAVQWSLYYPRFVSYRDFPLSGVPRSDLEQRRSALIARTAPASQDPDTWVELGEVCFDLGLRRQAQAAFERAIRLAPEHARARTGLGWVALDGNMPEAARAEFEALESQSLMSMVGMANALYLLDRWEEADRSIAAAKRRFPASALPWVQATLVNLVKGRPDAADADIAQALARDPRNALALGLRSNMLLTQNRNDAALAVARSGVSADTHSPSAQLALSLAQQANFQIADALSAARRAVVLDPESPLTLIQESRLLFGMGQGQEAFALAEEAHRLDPDEALVNSTLGFLMLARGNEQSASEAFERAIERDSTRAEPRLGLGLGLFRQNRTEEALEQMQIATLLEPRVALYQSYLGKALYEVKEDALAAKHFALAKRLDPRDPTPYFYNAIRLSSVNRPNEAVRDLLESVRLNDNRAVYRSRLLLDEDLAARGATMGRLHGQLGFDHLAIQEGQTSLTRDPADYSAHRLLADAYSGGQRYESARASELLQSQLLQPVNVTPVRPQLAETKLLIPDGAGPSELSLNEYTALFVRERPSLMVSGIVGSNATLGDETVVSGIANGFSYSVGQFHYETEGFRDNNDLRHDLYNAVAQFAVTPELGLQAEVRRRESAYGDLRMDFDPNDFSRDNRTRIEQDSLRLGARFSPSARSDLIASFINTNKDTTESQVFQGIAERDTAIKQDGYQAETQYLFHGEALSLVGGIGRYQIDREQVDSFDFTSSIGIACPLPTCEFRRDAPLEHDNAYLYAHFNQSENVLWSFGLSYDDLEEGDLHRREVNPKLGLQWNINSRSRLRLAAFQMVKPALVVEQTIEPTQVAGFNQLFDDTNAAKSTVYGFGFDTAGNAPYYLGIELTHRAIEAPTFLISDSVESFEGFVDISESLARTYVYWAMNDRWSLSFDPQYQELNRTETTGNAPSRVKTAIAPLSARYHDPGGFFSSVTATFVDQEVERLASSTLRDGRDGFFLVDAEIGYRLKKRLGTLSLEVLNLFDQEFYFQDDNFQTSEPKNPRFVPDRQVFLRFSVSL